MQQEGWICPRCGLVNAPWVSHCSCDRNITQNARSHTWECIGANSVGFLYHCAKCGEVKSTPYCNS